MRKLRVLISLPLFFLVHLSLNSSEATSSEQKIFVAAVGDSITWGFAIENRLENSWPARLEDLSSGVIESGNFGRSGTNLIQSGDNPYIEYIAYKRAMESSPDIVVIALGTNDVKGDNSAFLNEFIEDYMLLIQKFRELESRPSVFICYPPPVFPNRWNIDGITLKKRILPMIDQVAEMSGVTIIDLYSPLSMRSDLFPDGVHPNGEGAEIIAETIYSVLKESFISFL